MSDAPLIPGESLSLSPIEREALGRYLRDYTLDLEAESSDYLEDLKLWNEWYEAKPMYERRNDPWDGASNIVVPLIRYHSDALKARIENTIFATPDLWTSRVWNPDLDKIAKDTVEFLNYGQSGNEFDIYCPSEKWFGELCPMGGSVMALNWSDRSRIQFVPGEGGKPRPVQVNLHRGPVFTHIARENILWRMGSEIQDAEGIIVRALKSRLDLARMEQADGIDPGMIEKCKPTSNMSDGVNASKRAAAGLSANDPFDLYDIRQAWVEWPVLRGLRFERLASFDWNTPLIPLLVTFDYTTGTVLRAQGKPYYTANWTFYEGKFRSSAGKSNPAGIAKMLEYMQRAVTTIINQAIDTNTLSNSLHYITSDPSMQTKRFVPGRPLYIDDLSQFKEVPMNKLIAPDMALMNSVMAIAERLTGINDPALGREIRMGGHPSPATSTALMLQESKEMLRATIRQLRTQYSRMAEDLVTMYQQFEVGDMGRIQRALGRGDAESLRTWMFPQGSTIGSIDFDLKVLDENSNPETALRQSMGTMQMVANYWSTVINYTIMGANPQLPPQAKAFIPQAISAYTEAAKRVLDAGLVDDVERYVLELKESNFGSAQALQRLQSLATDQLGGMAPAGEQRPLPPIPTGPGGAPMATNGAATGSGF